MKRWFSVLLLVVIVLSTFAGCAGRSNTSSKDNPQEEATSKVETSRTDEGKSVEHLPYSGEKIIWKGYGPEGPKQNPNDACSKAWKEKVGNLEIQWELVPFSDYEQKAKIFLNSGDIPDVLPVGSVSTVITEYANNNMFLDFNQYLDYMPNLQEYRKQYPNMDYLNTADGKRYGIIGVQPIDWSGENYWANMDVLNKHNISMPGTFDEMINAMRQLKKADPSLTPWQSFGNLEYTISKFKYAMTGPADPIYWDKKDKKFKIAYREQDAQRKELIQLMANMYKEGLINPEIQTMSKEQEFSALTEGKWAFSFTYSASMEREAFKVKTGEEIPLKVVPMTPPANKNGERYLGIAYQHDSIPWWGFLCSKDVKHPEYLAAYMDTVVSSFGRDLFNYGVKDVTYDIVDGTPTVKSGIDRAEYGIGTQYEVWTVGMGPEVRIHDNPLAQKANILNTENFISGKVKAAFEPVITNFTPQDGEKVAALKNTFDTYVKEMEAKFIYGLRDISEWDAFVAELEKTVDMDKLLELYNGSKIIVNDSERIWQVKH